MMTYTRAPREYKKGIMKTGAMVSIVVGGALTAVNLYLLSAGRSCVLRKLHIFNRTGGNVVIQLGTGVGAAFVQTIPGIFTVNGIELLLEEEDLPSLEFFVNITVQSSAAGAVPLDVQVLATVEEFQGATG